jgi:hypothetical protein
MYIKIWKPCSFPVQDPPKGPKTHRDISWFIIEATRYYYDMYPREVVDFESMSEVDQRILRVRPRTEGVVELDEVCVLVVEAPKGYTVLFDTEAYVCNERGDTLEKISPMYRVRGDRVMVPTPEEQAKEDARHTPHGFEGGDDFKPCTKCGLPFGGGVHTDKRFPRVKKPKPNPGVGG